MNYKSIWEVWNYSKLGCFYGDATSGFLLLVHLFDHAPGSRWTHVGLIARTPTTQPCSLHKCLQTPPCPRSSTTPPKLWFRWVQLDHYHAYHQLLQGLSGEVYDLDMRRIDAQSAVCTEDGVANSVLTLNCGVGPGAVHQTRRLTDRRRQTNWQLLQFGQRIQREPAHSPARQLPAVQSLREMPKPGPYDLSRLPQRTAAAATISTRRQKNTGRTVAFFARRLVMARRAAQARLIPRNLYR